MQSAISSLRKSSSRKITFIFNSGNNNNKSNNSHFTFITACIVICCVLFQVLILDVHAQSLVDSSAKESITAVWTRGYNNARTYSNLNEKLLNTTNVNVNQFGKLFTRKVTGHIYAQVLYVPNVKMAKDGKRHNVIYVATMSNNVYAFDADQANISEPLWEKNFGPSLPLDDNPVGQNCGVFQDIFMEIGIVSTPVIDLDSNTIYFVTLNKDAGTGAVKHRLHAVDITNGQPRANSPVVIQAKVQGTGAGSENGIVDFLSIMQLQRMGLSLIDGIVYFGFGGYCFTPPYHGWLFGYDSATLERKFVFCSTPNGLGGGIWQGGTGISTDGKYLYMATANGDWNGKTEWSSSFLKIDPKNLEASGTYKGFVKGVTDHFTPYNQQYLGEIDLDVGATGVLIIPDSDILMGCSKFGRCYLVDKEDLGGYDDSKNLNVQDIKPNPELPEEFGFGVHSSPVTWNSPTKGKLIYVWGAQDTLRAFHFKHEGSKGKIDLAASEAAKLQRDNPMFPGSMMSLSAQKSREGSGIIWASHAETGNPNHEIRPGILRAIDANNINNELWNTAMNRDRDFPGSYSKWNPPTVAEGRVYLPTFSEPPSKACEVVVYGLLDPSVYIDHCYLKDCGETNDCCNGTCFDPTKFDCVDGKVVETTTPVASNPRGESEHNGGHSNNASLFSYIMSLAITTTLSVLLVVASFCQ